MLPGVQKKKWIVPGFNATLQAEARSYIHRIIVRSLE
jgi:hypothetical protein